MDLDQFNHRDDLKNTEILNAIVLLSYEHDGQGFTISELVDMIDRPRWDILNALVWDRGAKSWSRITRDGEIRFKGTVGAHIVHLYRASDISMARRTGVA